MGQLWNTQVEVARREQVDQATNEGITCTHLSLYAKRLLHLVSSRICIPIEKLHRLDLSQDSSRSQFCTANWDGREGIYHV